MSAGRIELILIATTSGNVIYERFYERVGEHEKAELRENLAEAAEKCRSRLDHSEFASRYRDSAVAINREGDLHFFAVGSGSYNELYLSELMRSLSTALREILRKAPSESLLLDNYARLCLVVDEMVYEGFVDKTEPEQINRGIMMKVE